MQQHFKNPHTEKTHLNFFSPQNVEKISNLSDGLVRKIEIFPRSNIYLSDFCLERCRLSSNSCIYPHSV